ncbi:MAG TPA: long-chain fatty acid--CoA ligase [Candidatus Thermoplasmatota archaeon]|nr:long-chain fatty acid--CoA ligase [Candidatus Thermoplasmatota archaeon]
MRIFAGPPLDYKETSLPAMFFKSASTYPSRIAVRTRRSASEAWAEQTFREAASDVKAVAAGLAAIGVKPGERVALLGETSWNWTLADFAIMAAGGVVVTVYPTLTADQISYLLNDSESVAIFADNPDLLARALKNESQLEHTKQFILFEGRHPKAMTIDELREKGREKLAAKPTLVEERIAAVKPDEMATIVYTSGTTGVPKGAVLTHRNFYTAAVAAKQALGLKNYTDTLTHLVFLPLAHCYGRLGVFLLYEMGGTVSYSHPSRLGDDLRSVQPQVITCVPRLYERMYDQIQNAMAKESGAKQAIFAGASKTAKEYGRALSGGGTPGALLSAKHALFEKLVYGKLREKLGFTKLMIGFTGAAAIRPELLYFFRGIGVPILEGYGLTETSAPSNVNLPTKFKVGTVGPPFPGMQQTLAEDGEVLMKGPNIFEGYYNLEKETAEAFTPDGWFRSGDIGQFDEDGYLRIIDRKKELEVLNTGKKIAPIVVEEKLKSSPYIGEALLVATDQKYAAALIQPNYDRLVAWAESKNLPFDRKGVIQDKDPTGQLTTYGVGRDLLDHADVQALYKAEVERINLECADFERVKAFRLVPHTFTIARDELTPTLKKKRRVIREHYKDLIAQCFA